MKNLQNAVDYTNQVKKKMKSRQNGRRQKRINSKDKQALEEKERGKDFRQITDMLF